MADRISLFTPKARIMWPRLFTPRKNKRGEDSYECDLVFTPEAQATPEFEAMRQAYATLAQETFGARLQGLLAAEKFIKPFWPGKRKINEDGTPMAGYGAADIYITVKSKQKPQVVQRVGTGFEPIVDPAEVYAGCWVICSVSPWAFDNESKGVSFGLLNVLKIADDTPLQSGGRVDAATEFAKLALPPAAGAGAAPGATATAGSLF